jgi:hypothetical protein
MKGGTVPQGYTILEAMIFLVVSAFILASALVVVSGQQARTQYSQGIRDLDAKIQQTINDVETGYFPQTNERCRLNSDGSPVFYNTEEQVGQGTNQDCIFLGKGMILGFQENDRIDIFTVAGRRTNESGELVASLAEARPQSAEQMRDISATSWGLSITRVARLTVGNIGTGDDLLAIGFITSLEASNSSSGSNRVLLYSATTPEFFGGTTNPDDLVYNSSIYIAVCVESANGNQNGAIVIGENGRQLTTTVYENINSASDAVQGACE